MSANRAHIATLAMTVVLTADCVAGQLLSFDDAPAGADAPVQGVAMTDGKAGDAVRVVPIGVLELTAATAIAKGAPVYSDAEGRPTAAGANNPIGRALRAASNPGDLVTVLVR